ncbi:hypothetical protein [Streptomyces sp. NBC_01205]|uniref:hypothetical protein n=1 Tax=Streptomyces sp. NBC_01205 TaxID=2903771 RepID=UPI002E1329C0|nr:hypothetical protein OG573_27765 [Streptomyces sp. NBC_01205]
MFAATCVLLASLAHVLMTGTAVPGWTVAAASVATSVLGWSLADRERGLLAVTSATVAVQAALHAGFSLAQAAVPVDPGNPGDLGGSFAGRWVRYLFCADPAAHAPAEHAHHAVRAMTVNATAVPTHMPMSTHMPMPMPAGHDMGPVSMSPTGMLAGHLLAALLCGLWLAYGEQGAFRVLRALAGLLLVPLRAALRLPAPADRPRLRARPDLRARPLHGLLLVHAITSRGPPHGIAVS